MAKEISRRDFLKLSGATAATLAVVSLGFDENTAKAQAAELKTANMKPTPTICPFCSVGCGILAYANEETVVYTEGDPDHPINRGSLCSKGTTTRQIYTSEKRVTKPMYRAAGSSEWEEKDWEWMLNTIADRVKTTRDASFIETVTDKESGKDFAANKVESIASFGGAALDNEECYALSKLMRGGLGLTYIEHQARI